MAQRLASDQIEFDISDARVRWVRLGPVEADVGNVRHAGGFTSGDGGVLRVGVLALDLTRRQARLGDTVADLADREFRLLHFLMLHPGEVISRQRLLSEVWGFDFDPRSNVVDVCVRRLRRQLGPDAPIETVRNAGYRAAA